MSSRATSFEDRLLAVLVAELGTRSELAPSEPRRPDRRVALIALLAAILIVAMGVVTGGSSDGVITVAVASISMEPTLAPGDVVSVDTVAYGAGSPARGDIVAFRRPDLPDHISFLRVMGLPGDTVTEDDGAVSVNGVALEEPYAKLDDRSGAWVVEPGHVFLMGDNRAAASDSRLAGTPGALGQVAFDAIIGRVQSLASGAPDVPAGPAPAVEHTASG